MRIYYTDKLHKYAKGDHSLRLEVDKFIGRIMALDPKTSADIKREFSDADTITSNIYIFNIKSDRMLCEVEFEGNMMFIRWVGSHDDYKRKFSSKKKIITYLKNC